MNTNEAINFLSKHQPMPADSVLTQEIIDQYDNVRKYFIEHPDIKAIPLFLRSFGDGNGWGVYQVVEDFFYKCPRDEVVLAIKSVLEDETIPDSVRYWTTQAAAAFSDDILRTGIALSLASANEDIKEAALLALEVLDES